MKFCYQLLKKCDVQTVFLITSGKQMSNNYYGYKFTKFFGTNIFQIIFDFITYSIVT